MAEDLLLGGAMPVLRPEMVAGWRRRRPTPDSAGLAAPISAVRAEPGTQQPAPNRSPPRRPAGRLAARLPAMPRIGAASIGALLAVAFVVWLTTGIYKVEPDELGIVTRFGRYVATRSPGLNYHLPYPIEQVMLPKVTQVNQLAIGSISGVAAQMLTGDENIVEANAVVFWRVKDPLKFLFNVVDPEASVRVAADGAVRAIIGRNPIQAALSDKRQAIADEAQELLQQRLDEYDSGIQITQVQLQRVDPPLAVIDAFNDVQRARADQERARNEAEAYRNDILPRARGEAEHIRQEAQAYREQVVNLAEGAASEFGAIDATYREAREITARRLYIETMEEVLKGATKVVIDTTSQPGSGIVPYLQLPPALRPSPPPTAPGATAQANGTVAVP
jgi:membrane protease subunit HflK